MRVYPIDQDSVVIDGRGISRPEVASLAEQHFGFKREDDGPDDGDHGFYLGPSPFHKYHVGSVCEGMYVVSRKELQTEETRTMVKTVLDRAKDEDQLLQKEQRP